MSRDICRVGEILSPYVTLFIIYAVLGEMYESFLVGRSLMFNLCGNVFWMAHKEIK